LILLASSKVTLHAYDQYRHGSTSTGNADAGNATRTRNFSTAKEFCQTFTSVVGHFGRTGTGYLPAVELDEWLTGKAWEKVVQQQQQQAENDSTNNNNNNKA
jgi:hypothetical protein